MLNMLDAMATIREKQEILKKAYQKQMDEYEAAYAVLFDMNEACEYCRGEGKTLRSRACAEDDRPDPKDPNDWNVCSHCHGTGLRKKNPKYQKEGSDISDFRFY